MSDEDLMRAIVNTWAACEISEAADLCVSVRIRDRFVEVTLEDGASASQIMPPAGEAACAGLTLADALAQLARRVLDRYHPGFDAVLALRGMLP